MPKPDSLTVHIMDKEYVLACPPEAQNGLRQAAESLDSTMREIRRSGKVFGTERIAVMAAVNLAYDLQQRSHMDAQSSATVASIIERMDDALSNP